MSSKNIKKLYYSISEVSQITSLKKYILRYWETEFSELRPAKNRAGKRVYRLNDIKTIFLIKKLLYQEKFTLEGAKRKLRTIKKGEDPQLKLSFDDLRREDALYEVRQGLKEILDYMDENAPAPAPAEDKSDHAPETGTLLERSADEDRAFEPDLLTLLGDGADEGPDQGKSGDAGAEEAGKEE